MGWIIALAVVALWFWITTGDSDGGGKERHG